jgi:arylsulfatase A-like enzyme/lipopolysaccharide biosynthesis regulator YciM
MSQRSGAGDPALGRGRIFALLGSILALACASKQDSPRLPEGTPVVLISIDTLRSDHLPAYGYAGVETPALDRLRADSILYRHAYSHIPLTLPSHSSIFSGLLPPEHKVRDNIGYHLETADIPYLPRLLQERGYATGAAVSAYVLRGTTGVAVGFDVYDDDVQVVSGEALGSLQRPGKETLEVALRWLDGVHERPFFLFFHIYEPHAPYEPPAPFAVRYRDAPYDGDIAEADRVVGLLLEGLQQLGVYDSALVILLSDHGEALGEHGQPAHEILVYRETLQVPLMVKLPRGERGGSTIDRPVQLIDVLPTVAELLGIEIETPLRGRSLLAAEGESEPRIYAESFYPRLHFGWAEQQTIVTDRYQMVRGPHEEIYDLENDPAQLDNIVRQHRRLADELGGAIDAISGTFEGPAAADPEVAAKLSALGYLGGQVETDTEGPRADPKDKMEVLTAVTRGLEQVATGDFTGGAKTFERVVAQEPELVDAWQHLGKARERSGDLDGALAAYQEALRLSNGAPQIALSAAELYFERGELDEAQRHAELAVDSHPVAFDLLAQIALRRGDLEAAERYAADAVTTRGTRVGPLVTQAQLRLQQGRLDETLELTRQAEKEFAGRGDRQVLRGMYFTRGSALARQGKSAAAIEAFRTEIRQQPDLLSPYSHLAVLYALIGETAKVGSTLQEMVETNPTPAAHAEAVRVLRQLGDTRSAQALLAQALRRWPQSPQLRALAQSEP